MHDWGLSRKLLISAAELPLRLLSFLIPRRRDLWVFGAWYGERYSDNSRCVFDYVCRNEPSIRAVWLSRRREIVEDLRRAGREAQIAGSPAGFWLCCRASLVFITGCLWDVNRPGGLGAKKIQLWHGTPLKKIGLDDCKKRNQPHSLPYRALKRIQSTLFPLLVERYDLIASPSPMVSRNLATAFGVEPSRVKVTGCPRGDVILDPAPPPVPVVEAFKRKWNATKVACYLPTHRGMGKDAFDLFAGLDIRQLHERLARHDAVLFVKMHFFHKDLKAAAASEECRICWLTEEEVSDINFMLPHTDVLITDYSGVIFDYLLLDRPILFAPFDKDRYLSEERDLYEDYDMATPGPKCMCWEDVILRLDQVLGGEDTYQESRRACRDRYNSFVDTDSCRRVVESARELL